MILQKISLLKVNAIVFVCLTAMAGCKKTTAPDGNTNTNLSARDLAVKNYKDNYLGSVVNYSWNGSTATCDPGTVSAAIHAKVLQRVNYFRSVEGLAPVIMDSSWNARDQRMALMIQANNSITHQPPATWQCFTNEGAIAAANSNLAYGHNTSDAVTGFIQDDGAGNQPVGHRRSILCSQAISMSHGSSLDGMVLTIHNTTGARISIKPSFIAWPPQGYVPQNLVYIRWSFCIPQANFSYATVTMTDQQHNTVPVTILDQAAPYGDPGIVWMPYPIDNTNADDVIYHVSIRNVKSSVGINENFDYDVTLIKP